MLWVALRTLLFVPGHKERFIEKAVSAGADGLLYDIEDSVPVAARREAPSSVKFLQIIQDRTQLMRQF